jgi:hypothetical protein
MSTDTTISKRAQRQINAAIRADNQEPRIYYSVWVDGKPFDGIHAIPVLGKAILAKPYNEFYDCTPELTGTDYRSPVVDHPTWLDIAVLFNRAVTTTGDETHCYLEGIKPTNVTINGVPVYLFDSGS